MMDRHPQYLTGIQVSEQRNHFKNPVFCVYLTLNLHFMLAELHK